MKAEEEFRWAGGMSRDGIQAEETGNSTDEGMEV